MEAVLLILIAVAAVALAFSAAKWAYHATMSKVCAAIAQALRTMLDRDEPADFFRGVRVLAEEIEQEFIRGIPGFRSIYKGRDLTPLKEKR